MTLERPSFVVAHVVYSTVPQDNRTGDGAARPRPPSVGSAVWRPKRHAPPVMRRK